MAVRYKPNSFLSGWLWGVGRGVGVLSRLWSVSWSPPILRTLAIRIHICSKSLDVFSLAGICLSFCTPIDLSHILVSCVSLHDIYIIVYVAGMILLVIWYNEPMRMKLSSVTK